MKWMGLTGGIACGKSTVSRLLRERHIAVVDADELARDAVAPGSVGFGEVVEQFGPDVVGVDGALDRQALGRVVFGDPAARARLEAIIHPRVREMAERRRRELEAAGNAMAFYDVPLLYEKGLEANFDQVVVVACSPNNQIQRLMSRNGLSRIEAEQRINSQLALPLKAARADRVLLNDGTVADLEIGVATLVSLYQAQT